MKQKAPVEKNQVYEMTITGQGSEGQGIGRVDGFAVFVPDALPGEVADVKILKVQKQFAYGKIETLKITSPDRTEPKCPLARRCGGCALQHMTYDAQLRFKTQKVKDAIHRIGGLTHVEVKDCIGMETPWHYRNKAQFPVGKGKNGIEIGFYAKGSHRIIDTDHCLIQHSINDVVVEVVRQFLEQYGISIYDQEQKKGLVRHILTRVGFQSGEVMVCLVVNGNHLPHGEVLVKALKERVPGLVSVVLNENRAHTNVILGPKIHLLWGKTTITDKIGEVQFEISPLSFYQVNPVQTKRLYELAVEQAGLSGKERVLDLYCGIGTISLFLAQKAKEVLGVEVIGEAIADAKRNAQLNGITNARFRVGASEDVIGLLEQEGFAPDVVVIDPPRKGCDPFVIETIAKMAPQKVVYVSCEPSTMARDLRLFHQLGFVATEATPVDQFGQSFHVETVALLTKEKPI